MRNPMHTTREDLTILRDAVLMCAFALAFLVWAVLAAKAGVL